MVQTFSLYALVGVDQHIDPAHKHPEGALCAAGGFYPPLQSDGEAATIQRTALLHSLRAILQPLPDFEAHRRGRLLGDPPAPGFHRTG